MAMQDAEHLKVSGLQQDNGEAHFLNFLFYAEHAQTWSIFRPAWKYS